MDLHLFAHWCTIALVSAAAFTALYALVLAGLSHATATTVGRGKITGDDRRDAARWVVTLVQNVCTTPLAWVALQARYHTADGAWFAEALPLGPAEQGLWASALVMGHALFDAAFWMYTQRRYGTEPDASLVLHHCFIWVVFPLLALYQQADVVVQLLILHEGSSPLIAARGVWLALTHDTSHVVYAALMVALLPAFVVCHDVVNLYLVVQLARAWRRSVPVHPVPWVAAVGIVLGITVLSALWTWVLAQRTRSAVRRYWQRRTAATVAVAAKASQ